METTGGSSRSWRAQLTGRFGIPRSETARSLHPAASRSVRPARRDVPCHQGRDERALAAGGWIVAPPAALKVALPPEPPPGCRVVETDTSNQRKRQQKPGRT